MTATATRKHYVVKPGVADVPHPEPERHALDRLVEAIASAMDATEDRPNGDICRRAAQEAKCAASVVFAAGRTPEALALILKLEELSEALYALALQPAHAGKVVEVRTLRDQVLYLGCRWRNGQQPRCSKCRRTVRRDDLVVDTRGLQACRPCGGAWLRSPLSVTLDGRDLETALEEVRNA